MQTDQPTHNQPRSQRPTGGAGAGAGASGGMRTRMRSVRVGQRQARWRRLSASSPTEDKGMVKPRHGEGKTRHRDEKSRERWPWRLQRAHRFGARVAQWIRRCPPKAEIAGSSPAVSRSLEQVPVAVVGRVGRAASRLVRAGPHVQRALRGARPGCTMACAPHTVCLPPHALSRFVFDGDGANATTHTLTSTVVLLVVFA